MPKAAKSINIEIGVRVKARRLALGMTRDELAKKSGYSSTFVQLVELGKSGLSAESLREFSMALNTSSDSLIFGSETDCFGYVIEKLKRVPICKRELIMEILDDVIECTR